MFNLFGETSARTHAAREKFTANKEQKKITRARQKAKKVFAFSLRERNGSMAAMSLTGFFPGLSGQPIIRE
jgi:hypothetical protein